MQGILRADLHVFSSTIKMVLRLMLLAVIAGSALVRGDGCPVTETEVSSRWIFVNDPAITCSKLISGIADTYLLAYRLECQYAFGSGSAPNRVENVYVSDCFTFENGTVKYKADICCAGVVVNSCYSCTGELVQTDKQSFTRHTDRCDFYSNPIQKCADGEVCMTTYTYGTAEKPILTVSKGCVARLTCQSDTALNSVTCKAVTAPKCVYCCDTPICNFKVAIKSIRPKSEDPCFTVFCRHQGTCVPDSTTDWGYSCLCTPGKTGRHCAQTVCSTAPCLNNGLCRSILGAPYYRCQCRISYYGPNCEYQYSQCGGQNVCLNGGVCYDQGDNGIRCHCQAGYVGQFCQLARSMDCGNGDNYIVTNEIKSRYGLDCTDLDTKAQTFKSHNYYLKMCRAFMYRKYGSRYVDGSDGNQIYALPSVMLKSCERGDQASWVSHGVCCSACLSAPCENGGWCITSAEDYVCKCRFGFEGKNCENKVSICYVSGDPHYMTFDGQMIHFQGACTYDMASTRQSVPGTPDFRVLTRNQYRNGVDSVSYVRYVEIHVYGKVVRFDRNYTIYVDGVQVYADLTYPGFTIVKNGRMLRLETDFSLVVESDTNWIATVTIPESLAGKMGGICADADGRDVNDLTTKEGKDVSTSNTKYSQVGNSWQVPNDEQPGCVGKDDEDPKPCVSPLLEQLDTPDYCGLIANPNSGAFRICFENQPHLSPMYNENCRYDVCANQNDVDKAKEAACGTLQALALECFNRGIVVDWRTEANCPMKCSPSMEYVQSGTACHATCSHPDSPEHCSLHETESCRCKDPLNVLANGVCVPAQTCECTDESGAKRPIGDMWRNDDCTKISTCEECTTCVRPVGVVTVQEIYCSAYETCQLVAGVKQCVDNDECANNPCANGATCTDKLNGYTCTCANGYTGTNCETDEDDCSPNPCQNGATCTDKLNGYTCTCANGYTGTNCETDEDNCNPEPCDNGATCVDSVAGYTCTCSAGFTGYHCETDEDDCSPNPCQNGATCTDKLNGYTCTCANGYTGTNCETDEDNCNPEPCDNGATCVDSVAGYTCTCSAGFTGYHCETDEDDCSPNPCQNGATCTDKLNGYTCTCANGYTGTNCETDEDNCNPEPCDNGATCVDSVAGYTCTCSAGFTGYHCETDEDDCSPNPCQNGATCTDKLNGYTCTCANGYTGTNCETDEDNCNPEPCDNGATCVDSVAGYTCTCSAGFTGYHCETDEDDCSPNPCQNGATCTDKLNGYTCTCANGYTGTNCETDEDNCNPEPCDNGATCVDSVAGYMCTCATGYTGPQCETFIDPCASSPCTNGGVCNSTADRYECKCVTDECEAVKDLCFSTNPCENGGSCRAMIDEELYNIMCLCPEGAVGPLCSTNDVPHWSTWTGWSDCERVPGSPMKCNVPHQRYRVRLCSDEDITKCSGERIEYEDCPCDTVFKENRDCKQCNITQGVGYLPDPCECGQYYICQVISTDVYEATKMNCPQCLEWQQETLTCGHVVAGCVANVTVTSSATGTSGDCALVAVNDPKSYTNGGTLMSCATGTIFSQSKCTCITDPLAKPLASPSTTCLNFQTGWNGFSSSNGVYVQVRGTRRKFLKKGYVGHFFGSQHLEIPMFSNAYNQFNPFSISFLYKRTGTSVNRQGLVNNGNCKTHPSLSISSTKEVIYVTMENTNGVILSSEGHQLSGKWNSIVLTYDGSKVILYVNKVKYVIGDFSGNLRESHCPLVIGHLANGFFTGYMDNLCIYKIALTEEQVLALESY